MKLFSAETYKNRRNSLKKAIGKGQVLFLGNNEAPMNYTDNTFRFRQDSSFLYYFGINLTGLSALIDIDNDQEIIFGHEFSIDDIIWIGPHESLASLSQTLLKAIFIYLLHIARFYKIYLFLTQIKPRHIMFL
jgi:Xaa-Pro aminopeptidase